MTVQRLKHFNHRYMKYMHIYTVLQITCPHRPAGKTVLSRRKAGQTSAVVIARGVLSWGQATGSADYHLGALFCNFTTTALGITLPCKDFNLFLFGWVYFFSFFS